MSDGRRNHWSVTVAAVAFGIAAPPVAAIDYGYELSDLELLGKNFFFDKQLSTPRGKQSCASCHEPKVGWILPLSDVNQTTVGAPGAQPGEEGRRKVQQNAYASFSPVFGFRTGAGPRNTEGGNFWDGRAEGCGKLDVGPDCQLGDGRVSETITPDDLPFGSPHVQFLGPTADQALNPTDRPGVEQNTREKTVCQMVKTAKYKDLVKKAWGEDINCSQQADPDHGDQPFYHVWFKRLAVAVAAWQASEDVNSFTSQRDACIRQEADPVNGIVDGDGHFPCDNLSDEANLGHDLFYGRNDSGLNRTVTGPVAPNPFGPAGTTPKWAVCSFCHNGVPAGDTPDQIRGEAPRELYADHFFHCIGEPYNRQIPTTASPSARDRGLYEHTLNQRPQNVAFPAGTDEGCSKTPSVRNAAKDEIGITKDFFRNGYFKSLKQVVHFYNTSLSLPDCTTVSGVPANATANEAMEAGCWPQFEFGPPASGPNNVLFGNLGLTDAEEDAIIAYIGALTDIHTPEPPSTSSRNGKK